VNAAELLVAAEDRLLGHRAAGPVERWVPPEDEIVERVRAARAPLVLAGPGVVRDGAIAGLQALAVAGSVGVLNTWGAKGVFDWRSRHHLATVGLQGRDAELSGVPEADLLLCTGVDEREANASAWRVVPSIDIAPPSLAPLAEQWSRPRQEIVMPALRERLAAATQAGWAATGTPMAPSQVTRNYGEIVAAGGTVAGDPGLAGFWLARTLGTTRPGAVHVPADGDATGFAVACAIVARRNRPDAPTLAVVDEMTPVMEELLDLGEPVAVEVWSDDGDELDVDAHRARLAGLVLAGGVVWLRTRPDQLAAMVDAAGPITAWDGLLADRS
jgi:acetolactate synthase-1/2/3 large subunit